jgi:hypothetical protein
MIQPRLVNRLAERFQFIPRAFHDQFHLAARQIANRAGYVEAGSHRSHSIPKADALHLARVNNLHSPAIHSIDPSNVAQSLGFRE